jgi:hypothetical protein
LHVAKAAMNAANRSDLRVEPVNRDVGVYDDHLAEIGRAWLGRPRRNVQIHVYYV